MPASLCADNGRGVEALEHPLSPTPYKERGMNSRSPLGQEEEFDEICGVVARGWCHPATEHKTMDEVLAEAIAQEVLAFLQAKRAAQAAPPPTPKGLERWKQILEEESGEQTLSSGFYCTPEDARKIRDAALSAIRRSVEEALVEPALTRLEEV